VRKKRVYLYDVLNTMGWMLHGIKPQSVFSTKGLHKKTLMVANSKDAQNILKADTTATIFKVEK